MKSSQMSPDEQQKQSKERKFRPDAEAVMLLLKEKIFDKK